MNTPHTSFRIWFSQRSGSTMLCQALEATGIAGKAGEFFTLFNGKSLLEEHQATDYESLKQVLWTKGSSANGVFGMKLALHRHHIQPLVDEVARLRNMDPSHEEAVWADLFPNCKHIYLTRRNKFRQAVSWWRAIHDNVWHLEPGKAHDNPDSFYEEKYNFDALCHLMSISLLIDCGSQQYFDDYGIRPLNIVYEDFIQDYENTLHRILDFLELPQKDLKIPAPPLHRTADHKSDIWVERFREDYQKKYSEKVW